MKNPNEMSFLDHLEDLRWHLIRSCLSILILASIAFLVKDFIFDTIIFGPKKIDFPTYRWFCNLSESFGQGDSFCITEMPLGYKVEQLLVNFRPIYGHLF